MSPLTAFRCAVTIQTFVTINGQLVQIMTDNNSIANTQDDHLKKSQDTPSQVPTEKKKIGQRTRVEPAWAGVPLGFRVEKNGKIKKRVGPSTNAERRAGRSVYAAYNLWFQRDGQRANRTYRVLFTNAIDPDKTFEVQIVASSLLHLLKQIPPHMGNLRNTKTYDHFTITCKRLDLEPGIVEETVPVKIGRLLTSDRGPLGPSGPLSLEDK